MDSKWGTVMIHGAVGATPNKSSSIHLVLSSRTCSGCRDLFLALPFFFGIAEPPFNGSGREMLPSWSFTSFGILHDSF